MTDARSDTTARTEQIEALVLFDGACNLCNGAVQFIIARDPDARFRFAPLQSTRGQATIEAHHLAAADSEQATMVLVEHGRAAFRSEAALRVARHLGRTRFERTLWRTLAAVGLLIPRRLRNAVYDWVARHRRHWFGSERACWVPTPELRSRFVD